MRWNSKCGFLGAIFIFWRFWGGDLQQFFRKRVWFKSWWHWFLHSELKHLFGGEAFGEMVFAEDSANDADTFRDSGGTLAEEGVGHGGRLREPAG